MYLNTTREGSREQNRNTGPPALAGGVRGRPLRGAGAGHDFRLKTAGLAGDARSAGKGLMATESGIPGRAPAGINAGVKPVCGPAERRVGIIVAGNVRCITSVSRLPAGIIHARPSGPLIDVISLATAAGVARLVDKKGHIHSCAPTSQKAETGLSCNQL